MFSEKVHRYPAFVFLRNISEILNTVKLGNKERSDKEQIGVKEPFL